ncbi:MAG TPA: type II toxin-antitoxin system VapC family toxin [Rhizomicrobium sp.]
MTTFIDTNILIYLTNPAEKMHSWSVKKFQECKSKGPVIISDIVYCEFSVGMETKSDVDAALSLFALERLPESDEALFRAGVAFKAYRANKGQKLNVLPDFLIGALAEVVGAPLLTANEKDILKYFPDVTVISP